MRLVRSWQMWIWTRTKFAIFRHLCIVDFKYSFTIWQSCILHILQYLCVVYVRIHCDFNNLNHIFMTVIILRKRGICDGVFNLFGFTMYFHLNQFASQRFELISIPLRHSWTMPYRGTVTQAKRVYCQFSINTARGREFTWNYLLLLFIN